MGCSPRITFLCRDSADMTKALRSGKYLGFMGRHNLAYAEDLTILPLENLEVSLPISLYWRKSDARNPALSAMRQSIIDFISAFRLSKRSIPLSCGENR